MGNNSWNSCSRISYKIRERFVERIDLTKTKLNQLITEISVEILPLKGLLMQLCLNYLVSIIVINAIHIVIVISKRHSWSGLIPPPQHPHNGLSHPTALSTFVDKCHFLSGHQKNRKLFRTLRLNQNRNWNSYVKLVNCHRTRTAFSINFGPKFHW